LELRTPDGRDREFFLHVPRGYNSTRDIALVFDSHGYTSNAEAQARGTGYRDEADRNGFAVVHAEGVLNSWNAGTCCGYAVSQNINDVLFFRMMVDEIATLIRIDRRRVFATGMSNGGFISHRLGLEAADVFNSIGPVAATAPYFMDRPDRAVGVYHIHGTDDGLVPYDGNLYFRSVDESAELWRDEINGCGSRTVVTDEPGLTTVCETFVDCPSYNVTICTHASGHIIPDYTAEKTWEFFAAQQPMTNFSMPAYRSIDTDPKNFVPNDKEQSETKWKSKL